jgi:TPR repeat protein
MPRATLIAFSAFAAVLTVACNRGADAGGAASVEPSTATSAPKVDLAALRAQAAQGNVRAQVSLARACLASGRNLPNYKEAARWSAAAATNGNPEAETILGELYLAGQGVAYDPTVAILWLTRAADAGWVPAQYDLAFMYETGGGASKNGAAAAKWFLLAAQGGDALAQFDYGQRCLAGMSVKKDEVEGLKWLLLAQAQGQVDAANRVKVLFSSLSDVQIAEAKKRAATFTPRIFTNIVSASP